MTFVPIVHVPDYCILVTVINLFRLTAGVVLCSGHKSLPVHIHSEVQFVCLVLLDQTKYAEIEKNKTTFCYNSWEDLILSYIVDSFKKTLKCSWFSGRGKLYEECDKNKTCYTKWSKCNGGICQCEENYASVNGSSCSYAST